MCKFFGKKVEPGMIVTSKAEAIVTELLAQELQKPMLERCKQRKVYARFKYNIWAVDLEEIGMENGADKYLLCVIDGFTKYAWVKPLMDKKAKNVL